MGGGRETWIHALDTSPPPALWSQLLQLCPVGCKGAGQPVLDSGLGFLALAKPFVAWARGARLVPKFLRSWRQGQSPESLLARGT